MLKLGGYEDYEDILRMSVEFFNNSPYKPLGIDEDRVNELIESFLDAPKENKIVILWVVEKPVGILAATAEPMLFNKTKIACELIWWIEPEFRRSRAAEKMRQAYEFWAKKVGCTSCSVVDHEDTLDKYYTRKGYERRETAYLKVL